MTKLVFLGTKGEIEEYTEKHKFNASLLIITAENRLLIDYGKLHKYTLEELKPDTILITHAHPDPYVWLNEDIKTDIPVYLTRETLDYGKYRPDNPRVFYPGEEIETGNITWSAYRVIHSIRCPAVGFKLKVNGKAILYNPDLVDIVEKDQVMSGIDYYIGDGSAIRANLVRRKDDQFFGHTRISTQINWCKSRGINNIFFTHLGKETIEKESEFQKDHPDVILAFDGMESELSNN
jgi:ribonuclease BN (tRNA processing enzyme)